jgi:FkbM family methyltransferase
MIETETCDGVVPVLVRKGDKGQLDRIIVDEVQVRDVYHVKELVGSGFDPKRIMDIGAHIGTFTTLAAHYFPNAWIHAFEPLPEEFAVLAMNLPANATALRAAVVGFYGKDRNMGVYRSHSDEQRWRLERNGNCLSASMAYCLASETTGKVDMMKLDCEQSEVNILSELDMAGVLKTIDVVHGEWHFEPARKEVIRILCKTHHVETIDKGEWNLFYADRR